MNTDVSYMGYRPGALAGVVHLQMDYYHSRWGFSLQFETKIACELAEFFNRFDTNNDLFLSAYTSQKQLIGSISIDAIHAEDRGAHLRWFIVREDFAGQGLGRKLMTSAISHCDSLGFNQVYLTTFEGLHAARALYESFDFELVEVQQIDQWNGGVSEQLFVRKINT